MPQARRNPVQQRSRERVEQILVAAAAVIAESGVDGLSTRDVAARASIPVASMYRYFANSDEILAQLLDREVQEISRAITNAVLALERVSLRTLVEATVFAHLQHRREDPASVKLWFAGRHNRVVLDSVDEQDRALADWLMAATSAAGFLRDDAPPWGAELVVRLADRMAEFALLGGYNDQEQDDIAARFVHLIATELEFFGTPTGIDGIAATKFIEALQAVATTNNPDSADR